MINKNKVFNKIPVLNIKTRDYAKLINKDLMFKKNYLPPIKEWPDSTYNFNKNNLKNLPIKDSMADILIKKFFYLVKKKNYNIRSRRMGNMIIKHKTNRLYLSKPEIKQTSDKNIITIYNYDREKESFIKKFFYYKRLLKAPSINNRMRKKKMRIKKMRIKRMRINRKSKHMKKWFLLKHIPLLGRKSDIEVKLYERKLFNKINNHKINKNKDYFFRYLFYKWVLSRFNIKINFFRPKIYSNTKFLVITKDLPLNKYQQVVLTNLGFIYKNKKSMDKLFKGYFFRKKDLYNYRHNYILNSKNIARIKNYNTLFYLLLDKSLKFNNLNISYKINLLYKLYKAKYYKRFMKILLLRKIRLDHIRKFYANNLKFNKYLPMLKLFLSRIYNKKIELNLIRLKYPYLNSDIFVNTLATKLRDRTRSLMAVVKRYLIMIKVIKLSTSLKKTTVTSISKNGLVNKEKNSTVKNITNLNNIKSKWITGMRLETAGRLTNRYVAQRSVYKYKYKGNLKSVDYKPINARTYISPNIQKSYVQSIRRIGAFGIKGWISSN